MTFKEQTKGVPLSWAQQGWRLQPDDEFDSNWRRASPTNRWDYEAIEVDGAYLDIARPVIEPANGPRIYAHTGWGNHLTPTPEMVQVWKWWWANVDDDVTPIRVIERAGELLARVEGEDYCTAKAFDWRGPVLPPVEAT